VLFGDNARSTTARITCHKKGERKALLPLEIKEDPLLFRNADYSNISFIVYPTMSLMSVALMTLFCESSNMIVIQVFDMTKNTIENIDGYGGLLTLTFTGMCQA
ncbi:hypothetical protein ACJX0J_034607, partial [Zea mays]